jgi:hypothetical protein
VIELLGEIECWRFAGAASSEVRRGADMNSAAEKRSSREYHRLSTKSSSFLGFDAQRRVAGVVQNQASYSSLNRL